MGSEWKEYKLRDVARVITGKTPPGTLDQHFGGDVLFVTPGDMDELKHISNTSRTLSIEGQKSISRIIFDRGIVVSCIGWQMGKSAIVKQRAATNQQINTVIADESIIDMDFLFYVLKSKREQIFQLGATATRTPIVKKSLFEKISFKAPSLSEQKKISECLSSIDDKIELNREMNATLEAMAQALFKSWFVDFDPVIDNALAAGNPIPDELAERAERRAKGAQQQSPEHPHTLPAAIRQQFPDRFVFTETMGWVPEGWTSEPLDSIASYHNGLALQKFRPKDDESEYLPVVKIAQLKKGYADGEEKASPNIKPECIIDNGDVVFSWSGSLVVDIWCGGKAALNQHLFKVTSDSFPKWFYHQFTCHHLEEFQRIAADKAVTMGHIKREHLRQALCVVPPLTLLADCSDAFKSLLDKSIETRLESRQLELLRDTLLPKLLSGQLRIPEAEQLVAEVTS
ncbi:restriction endonuclease subunit S [Pseudomonas saliphila]|uniref:restriction endonuclease subunit S n=1 Tax=Pseudomonas saliphila TaxID=2586906 RepID=UPI00123BE46C|nr:restriction endonuclease subunit S [Pseudomonas saliphila]